MTTWRSGSRWLARRMPEQPLPPPALDAFPAPLVALAARAWPMKAAEELRSAAVFAALHAAALLDGWPVDLCAGFASAAADELRHADLCRAVAAILGAPPPVADPSPVTQRLAALPPSPRSRALALLAVEVAVGETLSCALFRRGRAAAREPLARAALGRILRDEAVHARLGWEALGALPLDEADRIFLHGELRRALSLLEQAQALPALQRIEKGATWDPTLEALGVLSAEARVDAFYGTIERTVLPRLDRLGLDGAGAWAQRYR